MNWPHYLYIKGIWFTLSAFRSWKSFKTESLVDDSNALVVKCTFLFICRHGFEETKSPRKGVWLSLRKLWEEEVETGTQVKECMFMALCNCWEVNEVGKDKGLLTSDCHMKDIFRVAFGMDVPFLFFYGKRSLFPLLLLIDPVLYFN